jgi:hypothetical protein
MRFISGRWIVTSVVRKLRIRGFVVLLLAVEWNKAAWQQLVRSDTTFMSAFPLLGDTLRPMLPTVTTQTRSNLKNGLDLYAAWLSLNRRIHCLTCRAQLSCFKGVNSTAHNQLAFNFQSCTAHIDTIDVFYLPTDAQ